MTSIRNDRESNDVTREQKAERIGSGVRHAAAAESGEKNPSAEALCRFVRALGVSADLIAYPEAEYTVSDEAPLVRLIRACDVRDRSAIKAMAEFLPETRGDMREDQYTDAE